MTDITLDEAKDICSAAIGHAEHIGIKIAVSVVDSGTNLVSMQKMHGTMI